MIVYYTFGDGLGAGVGRADRSRVRLGLQADLIAVGIAVPANTIFGVACAHGARPPASEARHLAHQLADRPAARALAGRRRPRADPRLRAGRLVRRLAHRERDPDHLLHAGDRPGDDLRDAAVRRPRGDPGAPRGRDRPGRGGLDARRLALPDVPARHAAGDPLGRRLRRRPHDGPRARRVRRRRGRLGPDRRQDRDAHAPRRRGVPALQRGGRVHDVARARAARRAHARSP